MCTMEIVNEFCKRAIKTGLLKESDLGGIEELYPHEGTVGDQFVFLIQSLSEFKETGHTGLICLDVEAKLRLTSLNVETRWWGVEEAFKALCTMSHILRPSKDTLWPQVRECLSVIALHPDSGVRPWQSKKPQPK